ncbi:MAG TPA: orotidine-5'-phosphate decarboxylase [Actinomycetota bacterium]|nr:orotidine-5'-phosphate decarboxylase [Actinomycetota bacterium]
MSSPVTLDNPICVALDSDDADRVRALARATRDAVGMYKIGLTAYVAHGATLVGDLATQRPVFLDLKLHDIPMQVEGAARAAARTGASFVTVHALGGSEMVAAAVAGAGATNVLAVTVLTSLSAQDLNSLGIGRSPAELVPRLADAALTAGASGLVCSAHEVAHLRDRFGPRDGGGPLLVVPGIRDAADSRDDQRRTMSARAAVDAGADIVVIGRPITGSDDPAQAARSLLEGLE